MWLLGSWINLSVLGQQLDPMVLEVLFNPNNSMILWKANKIQLFPLQNYFLVDDDIRYCMYMNIYLNYHISNMVILIPNFHFFLSLPHLSLYLIVRGDIVLIWLEPTVLEWKLGLILKWPETELEIVKWRYGYARGEKKRFSITYCTLIYQIKHHVIEKSLFQCLLQDLILVHRGVLNFL